ncbi:protein mono-ADP-ribosyltransferase PARP11 isoform X2 [Embiotoca jacksoni]|uniref:protein mono-ADP-ribosyltransferase PARP11 isoform X2 n=1 Tax=Embiotoca jacksoni TaxID=100190 RepID=UPI0037043887
MMWRIWTRRTPCGVGITWQTVDSGTTLRTTLITPCAFVSSCAAMLQTNFITGKQRRVQRTYHFERRCSCSSAAPVWWEGVEPTCPYQLIPLSELSPEYQTVEGYVKNDGLLDKTIVSIIRIQNLDLWEIYCRKKKQLMRIQGVREIQERRLFHGTEIKNVDYICKYNFDLRLAGQNGHVFGKGIYFAKRASFADKYSAESLDPLPMNGLNQYAGRTKIQFLSRVMIGNSNLGNSHFIKPDHGSSENSHDSSVDDISHPNIFVIFDPNQIYPEYLIQYK